MEVHTAFELLMEHFDNPDAKGAAVKKVRREMNEVFAAAAPLEYVDYGVSNSGVFAARHPPPKDRRP